jgi:hypothetical protein
MVGTFIGITMVVLGATRTKDITAIGDISD